MQIKSPLFFKYLRMRQFLTFLGLTVLLCGCNQNKIPEEAFELPKGEYPKLVDVPNRPAYPSPQEVAAIQKNLESSRELALKERQPTG